MSAANVTRSANTTSDATLYLWEEQGGLCIRWEGGPETDPKWMAMTVFGRWCGGFAPFGRIDDRTTAKYALCVPRMRELFGVEVTIRLERPSAGAAR